MQLRVEKAILDFEKQSDYPVTVRSHCYDLHATWHKSIL